MDLKERESVQPYEYFAYILDHIKLDEIQKRQTQYEHLLLGLAILQPPVRPSLYTSAKITTTLYKLDDSQNYYYIYYTYKAFYIINKDKVSKGKKIW